MSNCDNSANSQLKALHARIERIDNDLIAHYAGISQLVAGLAAHPLTAPAVVTSLTTYNFSSVGQQLLSSLISLIPGVTQFKQLQHISAAQLVDGLAATLATTAENIAVSQAQDALNKLNSLNSILTTFNQALATATSLENQFNSLNATLSSANTALSNANASHASPSTLATLQKAVNDATSALSALAPSLQAARDALNTVTAAKTAAQSALNDANKVVSDINAFIQTLTDIASCSTHSSIMR